MTRVLLRNGHVVGERPEELATAVAWDDNRIVFVGDEDAAEAWTGADEVVDLHGALVTAAFTDAHVHVVRTGLTSQGLDVAGWLRKPLDLSELLSAVKRLSQAA